MNENPILPGFHPDPSICRVGDHYFLVNSTFQYLPGIPVHRSADLVKWEQIGNVYSRREQIDLRGTISSGGFYAPTIRHHQGRFYVVTSDLGTIKEGHVISSAEDPAGPWSVPVRTPGAIGIDPDLFWDEDGVCHLTWKGMSDTGLNGILSSPVDPDTGERLGEVRQLWQGTGEMASPEGPHLYRRGEFFYCLLAEGGTEAAHCATVARSTSLEGPWETNPGNPILTHRGSSLPVQNTGHVDLTECSDGSWVAVFLGIRPRGNSPKFHVNGRETFIAGVDWVDGWPVIDEGRFEVPPAETSFADEFPGPLDPRWISHGGNHWDCVSPKEGGGVSVEPVESDPSLPALAVRARDPQWEAEASVPSGAAALQLHMDTGNWAEVRVEGGEAMVEFSVAGIRNPIGSLVLDGSVKSLLIRTEPWPEVPVPGPGPDIVVFSVRTSSGLAEVARLDGRVLSTEATAGFTGRTIGVRAVEGSLELDRFDYRRIPDGSGPETGDHRA